MNFKIKKGLNLPITGEPDQSLDLSKDSKKVGLIGFDYVGMKPTMLVKEGDQVKLGQPVFSCKKNIGLTFTAPAAGKVVAVNRGERRVFQSLVIEVADSEEQVDFKSYKKQNPSDYSKDEVKALLLESGEWTLMRQRPFEKVADVNGSPKAVFINAMDTNPLAPNPDLTIKQCADDFKAGVEVLSKLAPKTYVSSEKGVSLDLPNGVESVQFSGVHPAGNVGTHIHFVDPVSPVEHVWHLDYQAVIAIGHLFSTGELYTTKVVSFAGPLAKKPRYIKVRRGACISALAEGEILDGEKPRLISGSVLNGRKVEPSLCYLGAFSNQITAIEENTDREFLGWHSPGLNKFSVKNIYLSKLIPGKKFAFNSNANGSYRAMVPVETFEKLMPLDILPTQLLRALCSKDTDQAQDLGCLELAEEDLALFTFADSGKVDYGPILRENLTIIEKEG